MASAPSGRYQSRLFNFVHRQSRRLTEQYARTFRHLQVSTNWSVQVLLYPVYRLFQSTELARKQLFSFVQQTWPQLQPDNSNSQPQTPPNADTPIQRVLLLVNVPSKKADTLRLTRPVVRGIATQLSSRTLVLVTAQNEILDILTTQQQQKLQEQIIGEVADYWRHQRLAYLAGQKNGEFILHPERTLTFLDRTIAELESNLAPVSEVALVLGKRSRELIHLVQTQLSVLLSGFPQPAGSQSLAIAPNGNDAHTFRIQALIRAAIDYFFGSRSRNLQQTTPTGSSLKLPFISTRQKPLPHSRSIHKLGSRPSNLAEAFSRQQPPELVSSDLDPWLTLDDLFGDSTDTGKPSTQTTSQVARKTNLLPSSQSAKYSLRNLLNRFQTFLPQPKPSGLVKRHSSLTQEKTTPVTRRKTAQIASPKPRAIASPKPRAFPSTSTSFPVSKHGSLETAEFFRQRPPQSNQHSSQSTQLDPASKWIETKATKIGYVKHPLEQLLEWLDRAMLLLEKVLTG